VRLRPGANLAAVRRTLQRLVPGNGGSVSSVQRPAEIVNYRSMGTAPAFLGAALAAAAVTALGLTLIASVRRRRRDLALLKTLGFTRHQLAAVVAWQWNAAVAAGHGREDVSAARLALGGRR
jgi:predicted lysophospholipase L1 biosynthesis ABC-type transport system permease subunit